MQVKHQTGLFQSCGNLKGQPGPSAWSAKAEDQRPVAVPHIPLRALLIAGAWRFPERIIKRDWPVLGLAALRTPAPNWNAEFKCGIQCCAINPSLTSGNDLQGHSRLLQGVERGFCGTRPVHATTPSGFCTCAKLHGLPPPFSPFHLKQSAGSRKSGVRLAT